MGTVQTGAQVADVRLDRATLHSVRLTAMTAVTETTAGGSPPHRTFHSPDPVTPVQNPRESTPISPARKLVLPVVTSSPVRPRGPVATRSAPPASVIATPEPLGEREQAIARVVVRLT